MTTHIANPADLLDLTGQTLGTTDWYELRQDQVNLFADATGDHQWIHTDPERAARGPFKGTIAHGYLTLALAPRVLADVLTIDTVQAALNYGLNKVRFPSPVPVGAKLRATVTVTSAQHKPAGVEVVYGLTYEVDGTERPACIADVVVLYR
ncbi:MaoC family dehydratase [Rhodococcus sp. LB1]|uniref:MaoC family dehydratase n=1 Tax=Rhodococcus sp. LB1 TaxID=1807499 RepID=UPI00077AE239|nr:MaoC family dehydratase [Rhodococcus sp. LB1]KXX58755.1 dehydratase [Rhodococcus sp. LB1]RZK75159.1 MAG: MaoC family dehydratase [Rhodococcus sp. (in: high G+C Gram-positive bacteria)]